jgi:hypothetical protein
MSGPDGMIISIVSLGFTKQEENSSDCRDGPAKNHFWMAKFPFDKNLLAEAWRFGALGN